MRLTRLLLGSLLMLALVVAPATAQRAEDFDPNAPTSGGPAATLSPNPWSLSEAVLYDNGPLETSPGESLVQTALGNSTFGFAAQGASGNAVADDFDVPGDGWTVDQATGFTYQSFSPNITTVTEVNVRVYDGDPNAGGAVVFDGSGGCLTDTTETNIFRRLDTAPGNTDRAIFTATCGIGMDLSAGTYWIEFGFQGSGASGPWAPPVTVLGSTAAPGANGQQFFGGAWQDLVDTGAGAVQAVPFVIEGDPISVFVPVQDIPTLGQWGMIALTLMLVGLGIFTLSRRRQTT